MHKISPNIRLEISQDGMKAFIMILDDEQSDTTVDEQVNDHEHEDIEVDDIIKEIRSILTMGLDENLLKSTLLNPVYDKKICIANGIQPIDGKDGYIKYFFEPKKKLVPKILEDGTVDYRELGGINNVDKGEQLAQLVPPEKGEYGFRVTGEMIPYKKGRQPILRYGKNTILLDDGVSLVAGESGLVRLRDNKVIVAKVFEVSSVDKEVGNINFNGAVIVNRNVLNGYHVKASGDVEVRGLVEGGCIQNTGDVLVKQGIQGYNRLAVNTEGNITTKFIENAKIQSAKNITAETIMHSYVVSGEDIILIGKRGLIAGGICRAGGEIRAKTIGSSMATTTVLEIGLRDSLKAEIDKIKEDIEEARTSLRKVIKSIDILDALRKSNGLDEERLRMYNRLINTKKELDKKIYGLIQQEESINRSMKKSGGGRIKVSGIIYPGVKIVIGNSIYFVKNEMTRCTFYCDEGSIKVGPY
ncbi:MAG: DUF342 domain-containing protein [Tissierellia bacterium]|nr:DUF342 domain-containing protein [Tissierellia bacterium]